MNKSSFEPFGAKILTQGNVLRSTPRRLFHKFNDHRPTKTRLID